MYKWVYFVYWVLNGLNSKWYLNKGIFWIGNFVFKVNLSILIKDFIVEERMVWCCEENKMVFVDSDGIFVFMKWYFVVVVWVNFCLKNWGFYFDVFYIRGDWWKF